MISSGYDKVAYDLSGLHVLVVEDNVHTQSLIKAVLRSFNVGSVEIAADGEAGFELFNRMHPDLVITDWEMGPADGIELVDRIRRSPESADPYVPVIMVTANTELHRVKDAINHGIHEFLAKPISPIGLYTRICKIIEHPRMFIRSDTFIGPDRRRNAGTNYDGPNRRGNKAKMPAPPSAAD
ncbi:MAG: response regulator [Rhodospirillales bacterium]